MTDHKILLFILPVIIYSLYSDHMWFPKHGTVERSSEAIKNSKEIVLTQSEPQCNDNEVITNTTQTVESDNKSATDKKPTEINKSIPFHVKNSILQVFTVRPIRKSEAMKNKLSMENNILTDSCITLFVMVLSIDAVLDTLKAKEEENAKRKLNPEGEWRLSLAEFANKKSLRRESRKFGLQRFQIAKSMLSKGEEKKEHQPRRPYTRGDSTISCLSKNKHSSPGTETPIEEATTEASLTKMQSVSKQFGTMAQKEISRKSDPIEEAFLLRAVWKKTKLCRQRWQERWSWLLDEQKKAQEEAVAIRREAAANTHLQVCREKSDKSLKPVPPTSAGMVGWLASKDDCQLEIYTYWQTQIPHRLPDAWEHRNYQETKKS